MVRHARLIAGCALVALVLVVGYALLQPRVYTAQSAVMPQTRTTPLSGLTGLVAQLGVLAPGVDAGPGPAFYVDLAKSPELLYRVVDEPAPIRAHGSSDSMTTLVQYYRAKGGSAEARRAAAVARLQHDIATSANLRTGVVRVRVTLEDPKLAAAVNERLMALLNEFNLRGRQTQAGQERQFLEQRLAEVRADLNGAEGALAAFMRRNQEYTTSPDLRVQHDRLSREVTIQQQLYISLAQSYEQAKIEEVRNTPVLSVVEHPRVPVRPDSRFLALRAIIALVAGALIGLLAAAILDFVRRRRVAEAAAYERFREERRRVGDELRAVFRR